MVLNLSITLPDTAGRIEIDSVVSEVATQARVHLWANGAPKVDDSIELQNTVRTQNVGVSSITLFRSE